MTPTVTQVIDYFFGEWKKHVQEDVLLKAREEGTELHEAIERFLKTGETDSRITPAIYWLETYNRQLGLVREIEKRFISQKHGFSGKPDIITDHAIIDWKSRVDRKYCRLQMAGYSILAEETGYKPEAWIAYDLKKGRAYNVYDKKAKKEFLKLLKIYKEEAYEY